MENSTDWYSLKVDKLKYRYGILRLVELHCLPELPEYEQRECVVELKATGEWLIATYDAKIGCWLFAYGPVERVALDSVTQWAYIDELFAGNIEAARK